MDTLGEKIYNLRKEKKVSQEKLALELGVARQTVSKWENDSAQPSMDNLKYLCAFFGIDSAYFFDDGEKTVVAKEEAVEQIPVTEKVEIKEVKFKFLKTVLAAVGVVFLILCLIASVIASYITIAPDGDETIYTVDSVNYIGIICVVIGIFVATILITLLIIFIKKRRKK